MRCLRVAIFALLRSFSSKQYLGCARVKGRRRGGGGKCTRCSETGTSYRQASYDEEHRRRPKRTPRQEEQTRRHCAESVREEGKGRREEVKVGEER